VLEETLRGFGFEVTSCADGITARNWLQGDDGPEIAILDWMMPGMDGPEVCRALRKPDEPRSNYIILLTGKRRKEDLIEGLQAGADDYITKPFDPEELRARVRVGQRMVDLQRKLVAQETAYYIQQLEQAVQDLQESRSRIVSAQESLRRTIAEELHGKVQTHLVMMNFRLADIKGMVSSNVAAAKAIDEVAGELEVLRENEIRQISHRLHPSVIKISLLSGLRSLADQFDGNLPVSVSADTGVAALEQAGRSRIPQPARLCMYRVAEEALVNVVKHAAASNARISLWLETTDLLCMTVEDNGKGFEPEHGPTRRSIGLVTMEDYVGAIGGSLKIESEPGRGTRVTATVPIKDATGGAG
jgi:signal transduction histidine kinase